MSGIIVIRLVKERRWIDSTPGTSLKWNGMEEKKLPVIVTAVTEIEEDGGKAFLDPFVRTAWLYQGYVFNILKHLSTRILP